MKLLGIRDGHRTDIGRLFDDGTVAPLAEATEYYADLERWTTRAAVLPRGERPRDEIPEAPAVPPAARVLCVGLNYQLHAEEAGLPMSEHSAFLGRWTVSLVSDGVPVPVPAGEPGLDREVELAVVVGRPCTASTRTPRWRACWATRRSMTCPHAPTKCTPGCGRWARSPIGAGPSPPSLPPTRSVTPRRGLRLQTRVDGEVVQDGSTSDMIFSVGEILAYLSGVMTLNPGDVVTPGTPQGEGFKRTPPRYLGPGDVVEVKLERVGAVANPVVAQVT